MKSLASRFAATRDIPTQEWSIHRNNVSRAVFPRSRVTVFLPTDLNVTKIVGNAFVASAAAAAPGDCYMGRTGNATEQCGGPNKLNLFQNDSVLVASF